MRAKDRAKTAAHPRKRGSMAACSRELPSADYDKIGEDTTVDIVGLADLAPDQPVTVRLNQPDGSVDEITCTHTLSPEQIDWFEAGSALNIIRKRGGGANA